MKEPIEKEARNGTWGTLFGFLGEAGLLFTGYISQAWRRRPRVCTLLRTCEMPKRSADTCELPRPESSLHTPEAALMSRNKDTYEAVDIVRRYSAQSQLQKPEETILHAVKDRLRSMKMLDIGVGGGRTTVHFAGLVKEYVGIDYSQNMIDSCKKRFPDVPISVSFKTCDVRCMKMFDNDYFGFVLFSFCGLDYIPHEDRLKALREIRRVTRDEGLLCFSTHNLQGVDKLFPPEWSLNPKKMLKEIVKYVLFFFLLARRRQKFKKLKKEPYAIVNDGAHWSRLTTYYIKPKDQIRQLQDLGFGNIRVFSYQHGKQIADGSELDAARDCQLYYLCDVQ